MTAPTETVPDMTGYFKILDDVRPLLVTRENPAREDLDGMDYERCAALHNAILKHGWVTSGRDPAEFDRVARPVIDIDSDAQCDRPSSIRAFLAAALTLEDTPEFKGQKMSFFFYLDTLCPHGDWHDNGAEEQILTFYGTLMGHASKMDGLVYDFNVHKAYMHFDLCHWLEPYPTYPWQPLESILSVWVEMILCQKVVAIPDLVGREWHETGSDGLMYPCGGPVVDSKTGARRWWGGGDPWTIQPYTNDDLTRTLAAWETVVTCIESKMGLDDAVTEQKLLTLSTVIEARIPDGFAREFLTGARKPRFTHIAPGLIVPDAKTFIAQQQLDAEYRMDPQLPFNGTYDTPSILLFRGDGATSRTSQTFVHIYDQDVRRFQYGLYLRACQRDDLYPVEDGFELVLPFAFGDVFGNPNGHAKLSDGTPSVTDRSLLQHGNNSYNHGHLAQLRAFFDIVSASVKSRHWRVNENGVAGGIDVWKKANSLERWKRYVVPVGPGEYW